MAGASAFSTEEGISIYFVIFSSLLALVLILSKLLHDRPCLAKVLPEAGMVMLVGIGCGAVAGLIAGQDGRKKAGEDDEVDEDVAESLLSFSPDVFFLALLPPIIFNSGYHLRRKLFFRHITPILLFACVGTLVSALVIAFLLEIVRASGLTGSFDPHFSELLAFGALISATDPVSTLAVFQAKRVDPQLFYLVFGESVMNDAVGLVLFNSFATFVQRNDNLEEVTLGILELVLGFILDSFGSLCLGFLSGMGAAFLLKWVDMRQHPLLELSVYVLIMYVPFMVAEIIHVSGIVTILFTGVSARRYAVPNLSPETESNADVLFRLAAHLAETSIFLELGLSVFGITSIGDTWQFVMWSIFGCLVGRAANVYPISYFFNYSLGRDRPYAQDLWAAGSSWLPTSADDSFEESNIEMMEQSNGDTVQRTDNPGREHVSIHGNSVKSARSTRPPLTDLKIKSSTAHMLWFSGLRGAVAYACARSFPDTFKHKDEFVATTMIIVLVTVFILGGTTEPMLNLLSIEMDVDEDQYMEANYKDYDSDGLFLTCERRFIYPCVFRSLDNEDVVSHAEDLSPRSDRDESSHSGPRLERCESGHMELTDLEEQQNRTTTRKKESLYDYGAKKS